MDREEEIGNTHLRKRTVDGLEKICYDSQKVLRLGSWSLVVQLVENLSAMQETLVQFLGWEDLLEKGYTTHSSILELHL